MDYSLLRRSVFRSDELDRLPDWDVLLSAYNSSARVATTYQAVRAVRKQWLVHPEYGYDEATLAALTDPVVSTARDEAEFWHDVFTTIDLESWPTDTRICVDITGFMRPHVMLLPRLLRDRGFSKLDVVYSDPIAYESGDRTRFSKGPVVEVRQVRGFEGAHDSVGRHGDVLIIGAGYDDELIRRVAESKRAAAKMQMFGLPSLQPHMYSENRKRAAKAEEAVGPLSARAMLFAPANDPFATAQELHDRIAGDAQLASSNIYLSPLATKVQALGFAIYYLCECVARPVSVIFPYADSYSPETTIGFSRLWVYELELDWFATR